MVTEDAHDTMNSFVRKEYNYDNRGYLTKVQEYTHYASTKQLKPTFKDEFQHVAEGPYKMIRSNADEIIYKRIVTVNDDFVSEAVYGEHNELKERIELIYDARSRVLSRIEFSVYDVEFADDESQQGTGKEYVADKHVYTYDENGFLISEINQSGDDDGGITENYRIEYTNDNFGNPVLSVNTEPDGIVEILKFEYKYDNSGNWIERKQFEAEVWDENDPLKHRASLKYIAEREISYE